jgi:acyl-CoA oxidase
MDLEQERRSASFNVENLTKFLYGDKFQLRRKFLDIIESNPVFDRSDLYYMDRTTFVEDTMKKEIEFLMTAFSMGLEQEDGTMFNNLAVIHLPITGLHFGMFLPTLRSQASEEQLEEWLPLAWSMSIIGTYAQTELGHGTNLKSIETTAVYDIENQEFVLNTPNLTSMKWWPGGLGKLTTHCIVIARLIIRDTDYGFHQFLLPIRDLENHTTLPGIVLGDIGPKEGDWNAMNNGRMELYDVRIPRENMLMRYSKVSPEGEYTKPPHSKLAYGSMSLIRATVVGMSADALSKGITIAIRYSLSRRQGFLLGEKVDTEPELKVLDYGSQQYALFPVLASSYALYFTGKYMWKFYLESTEKISKGDYSVLPEFHATTSGLKAQCTWIAVNGLEEARQRCGGHGFLRAAGIADLYMNILPACTYEGDNNVLCQQTCRYLLKAARDAVNGVKQVGNIDYLNDSISSKCLARNSKDFLDGEIQLNCFRRISQFKVLEVFHLQQSQLQKGIDADDAWNYVMPFFKELNEAHCLVIIARSFIEAVSRSDSNFHQALKNLCDLFSLFYLNKMCGVLILNKYLSKKHVRWINEEIAILLGKIRQDAIALADAWDHRDYILNSAIGKYNGDVYEELYEASKKSTLNQTDVLPAYYDYIRPLLNKASL